MQLCLFTTQRFVHRKAVTQATKMPNADMKDMLQQLAVYRSRDAGWEFALPFDEAFVNK